MRYFSVAAASVLVLAGTAFGYEIPEDHYLWGPDGAPNYAPVPVEKRAATTTSRAADPVCTNGPLTRSCWADGYSVATDFDAKWPNTGVTRSYTLNIVNTTCNFDGNQTKPCMLYNGQYPGPTIEANWGDTISVKVTNQLQYNGTSVHWHGIRQLNTNTQDGVNGLTECPLAPGDSKTYTFKATQFGTSWYHSHFSSQYGNGLVGPIKINGPASANYDVDLGPYPITDYYYATADVVDAVTYNTLQTTGGGPPTPNNILVNGTARDQTGKGSYKTTTITKGKKYLLRLINTSVEDQIRVSLDSHVLSIVSGDFVPTHPVPREWILLGIGQRYEVIITANQTVGNYWFRAEVATDCASGNAFHGRGIFSYVGAASGDPVSTPFATPTTGCQDETGLVAWVPNTVPSADFSNQAKNLNVNIGTELLTNNQSIVFWNVNSTGIDIDWEQPTLEYVKQGNTNYPHIYNVIEIPNATWTYWVLQEDGGPPIPHPIHLHGHDFYILGHGTGTFTAANVSSLNFNNPYRRDVTFLPAQGWVVIAFPADNPGAWLMHCHIAGHISGGLGVQFLERKSEIVLPDSAWEKTCTNWRAFYDGAHPYNKLGSGLR